jgi:hypothetical protein
MVRNDYDVLLPYVKDPYTMYISFVKLVLPRPNFF